MSNRLKLAVGIPAYGGVITACQARQWMEFGSTLGGSAERFELVSFGFVDANPIDKARNMLLNDARKAGANWLLMIDADTWIEPEDPNTDDAGNMLLRMISDADRKSATIVVAPVRQRDWGDDDPVHMIYKLPASGWAKREKLIPIVIDDLGLTHTLFPIDAAATACMAINLPQVQGLQFKFNYELGLSEDLDFCRQVKEAAGRTAVPIWYDPRVRTGHTSRTKALYSR